MVLIQWWEPGRFRIGSVGGFNPRRTSKERQAHFPRMHTGEEGRSFRSPRRSNGVRKHGECRCLGNLCAVSQLAP